MIVSKEKFDEKDHAPVAFFIYNRPGHTKMTLEALAKNEGSSKTILYVFADGPKASVDERGLKNIHEARAIIKKQKGFKDIILLEQEHNQGLANSIISGVSMVLNKHGRVIVLEDDIVTSRYFLGFMNDSLDVYEKEENVIQVGACNFFATGRSIPSTFFVHLPDCWGWATWKDRWDLFEKDANLLLKKLRSDKLYMHRFNCFGVYDFESMLQDQVEGRVDSWAIRWQAVCVLNNKMILYPNPSLSNHIASQDATHQSHDILTKLATRPIKVRHKKVKGSPRIYRLMKLGYGNKDPYVIRIQKKIRSKFTTIIKKFK